MQQVKAFGGRLWIFVEVDPFARCEEARGRALKACSRFALALGVVALAGCGTRAPQADRARMALLEQTNERLHERLAKAAGREPLVASALQARGQVVLAIRSRLIEEIAATVARGYLDRVTVDLSHIEAHGSGELEKKTLLGRVKVGEWSVSVDVGDLVGHLRVAGRASRCEAATGSRSRCR